MMTSILHQAALGAQNIIIDGFEKNLPFTKKENHRNLLSQIDEDSQNAIKKIIIEELKKKGIKQKSIGFIGEENLRKNGEHLFIIDPLDGTTNFISKIPYFGISIAYVYQNEIMAAVILDPTRNKLCYAGKGKGAFIEENRQDSKLRVQKRKLSDCLMNTYFSADNQLAKQMFKTTQKIAPLVRGVRSLGSGAMESADFCQNKLGVLLSNTSWIWDIASTKLIVEEAGGEITDWQGNEIKLDFTKNNQRYPSLIAHPELIPKIVKIIN